MSPIQQELVQEVQRYVLFHLVRMLSPDGALLVLSRVGDEELEDEILDLPPGPDRSISLSSILDGLIENFGLTEVAAQSALVQVGMEVTRLLNESELDFIRRQLPEEMRTLFLRMPRTAA